MRLKGIPASRPRAAELWDARKQMGWMAPAHGICAPDLWKLSRQPRAKGATQMAIIAIGLDLAKTVFQVHALGDDGKVMVRAPKRTSAATFHLARQRARSPRVQVLRTKARYCAESHHQDGPARTLTLHEIVRQPSADNRLALNDRSESAHCAFATPLFSTPSAMSRTWRRVEDPWPGAQAGSGRAGRGACRASQVSALTKLISQASHIAEMKISQNADGPSIPTAAAIAPNTIR